MGSKGLHKVMGQVARAFIPLSAIMISGGFLATAVQAETPAGGDEPVAAKVVEPAVAAAADTARKAVGVSAATATAVGIVFTPSTTAPPSMDECRGTNCTKGFPSNAPPK